VDRGPCPRPDTYPSTESRQLISCVTHKHSELLKTNDFFHQARSSGHFHPLSPASARQTPPRHNGGLLHLRRLLRDLNTQQIRQPLRWPDRSMQQRSRTNKSPLYLQATRALSLRYANIDPQQRIQTAYQTHRANRNTQQKAKLLASDFSGVTVDEILANLEDPSKPDYQDPRHCLVFWARPPIAVCKLILEIQQKLLKVAPCKW
jgi:hypothetical protein